MKPYTLAAIAVFLVLSDVANGQGLLERRRARIQAMAPPQTVVIFTEYRMPSGPMIGLAELTERPVPVIRIPPRPQMRFPAVMSRETRYAIDPRYYGQDCVNGQCGPSPRH